MRSLRRRCLDAAATASAFFSAARFARAARSFLSTSTIRSQPVVTACLHMGFGSTSTTTFRAARFRNAAPLKALPRAVYAGLRLSTIKEVE